MNKTDAASVRAILESHRAPFPVDERLWREVDRPGEMFLGTYANGPLTMAVFDDTCGNLIQIAQK
jgi:hypothetical protein